MRNQLVLLAIAAMPAALLAGCETTPVQQGALIGGAIGAGSGAIIGNQSHHAGSGALIGAAAGGLGGALFGDMVGQQRAQQAPPPPPPPPPPPAVSQRGHYENRRGTTSNGESYEERVFVQD